METYSTKYFIVHFNHSEQSQIEVLFSTLQDKLINLMSFFKLQKLKKPINIYIYSDKNEYANHILKYTDTYQDWMIGDTGDGNINMLSLEKCKIAQSHKGMTLSEWVQVVIHELVHICQQEVNSNAYGCGWFWEALALNLSGQILPETAIDCTKEQLMFDYLRLPNGYPISYTIGKYMLVNYPHERLIEYITNPQQLWDDTEAILNDVKNKG